MTMTDSSIVRRQEDPTVVSGWGDSAASKALVPGEGGAVSVAVREEAEMKAAIVLARSFPRQEADSYTKIIKSCQRPSFAESAVYAFPRGGQTVSGPSVDLAREMARCWGNIRYGLRVVTIDNDYVHIKGYAIDLESNNLIEAEDKFRKLIQRKGRGWVEPDERDLRELINRRGAILVRNCILQIMPPDIVDDAVRKSQETMVKAANGEVTQDKASAVRRLTMAFDSLGVTAAMLIQKLGHGLDAINAEEIAKLRTIYKSISDGNSKREEHFIVSVDQGDPANKAQEAIDKLTKRPVSDGQTFEPDADAVRAAVAEKPAPAPKATAAPAAPSRPLPQSFQEAIDQIIDIAVARGDDENTMNTRVNLWKLKTKKPTPELWGQLVAAYDAGTLKDDGSIGGAA